MKKHMYLSISLLCLSIAALIGFRIGSHAVKAQAPEAISGWRLGGPDNSTHFVMLSNEDVYHRAHSTGTHPWSSEPLNYSGNFWTGSTISTGQSTWSNIKGEYKDD